MGSYSQISCKEIGKVLYNSTFKGRENGPGSIFAGLGTQNYQSLLDNVLELVQIFAHSHVIVGRK